MDRLSYYVNSIVHTGNLNILKRIHESFPLEWITDDSSAVNSDVVMTTGRLSNLDPQEIKVSFDFEQGRQVQSNSSDIYVYDVNRNQNSSSQVILQWLPLTSVAPFVSRILNEVLVNRCAVLETVLLPLLGLEGCRPYLLMQCMDGSLSDLIKKKQNDESRKRILIIHILLKVVQQLQCFVVHRLYYHNLKTTHILLFKQEPSDEHYQVRLGHLPNFIQLHDGDARESYDEHVSGCIGSILLEIAEHFGVRSVRDFFGEELSHCLDTIEQRRPNLENIRKNLLLQATHLTDVPADKPSLLRQDASPLDFDLPPVAPLLNRSDAVALESSVSSVSHYEVNLVTNRHVLWTFSLQTGMISKLVKWDENENIFSISHDMHLIRVEPLVAGHRTIIPVAAQVRQAMDMKYVSTVYGDSNKIFLTTDSMTKHQMGVVCINDLFSYLNSIVENNLSAIGDCLQPDRIYKSSDCKFFSPDLTYIPDNPNYSTGTTELFFIQSTPESDQCVRLCTTTPQPDWVFLTLLKSCMNRNRVGPLSTVWFCTLESTEKYAQFWSLVNRLSIEVLVIFGDEPQNLLPVKHGSLDNIYRNKIVTQEGLTVEYVRVANTTQNPALDISRRTLYVTKNSLYASMHHHLKLK